MTNNIWGAFLREIQRICSSRYRYFIPAVVIPLFSLIFMATIFGNGKIENLPIGVVDLSNSTISREIINTVKGSPVLTISFDRHFSNEAQAKKALQNMDIFGYFTIPEDFETSLHRGESPTVTYYYHYALLAVGGEINGAFAKAFGEVSSMLALKAGNSAGISPIQVKSVIMPTDTIFTATYNASLNYSTFLSYPFFFIFFQIFILVFTVYIIGTDLTKEWLHSGGKIYWACIGKLFPYTIVFITQSIAANYTLFCIAGIPLHGSLAAITSSSILLVAATVSLGVIIISLIPKVSIAISIASMIGALGATTSGVTFPIESMYTPFRIICSLFPIRHFIEINQGFLYSDSPIADTWYNWIFLCAITVLPYITSPFLSISIEKDRGKPLHPIYGTSLVILGGTIGYGFLYSLMYNPNIVENVPVAVVDQSSTPQSREYIESLNSTQGVRVYAKCPDIQQAKKLMQKGQTKGIFIIPYNFAENTTNGEKAITVMYETTSSFLYYLTIQEAAAATMQQYNNALRPQTASHLPLLQQLSIAQAPTFTTNGVAVYNNNGGYSSYLLPIAIIVILFQTMLMSGGILSGSGKFHTGRFLIPLIATYLLLSLFLTGLIPIIFDLPHLAKPVELYLFMLLFIITTAAFIGAVTHLFKDSEEVMLYVPFFSIGLIFLSGTSFPMIQIPHIWQILHYIVPTSPAINGYIKLNSMGGNLHNILPDIALLSVQLLIYSSIYILYKRKIVNLQKKRWRNSHS